MFWWDLEAMDDKIILIYVDICMVYKNANYYTRFTHFCAFDEINIKEYKKGKAKIVVKWFFGAKIGTHWNELNGGVYHWLMCRIHSCEKISRLMHICLLWGDNSFVCVWRLINLLPPCLIKFTLKLLCKIIWIWYRSAAWICNN